MASVYKQVSKAKTGLDATAKGKRKADAFENEPDASEAISVVRKNKQRVLMLPSRGVTSRMRHLINDLEALMPHSKKGKHALSPCSAHLALTFFSLLYRKTPSLTPSHTYTCSMNSLSFTTAT